VQLGASATRRIPGSMGLSTPGSIMSSAPGNRVGCCSQAHREHRPGSKEADAYSGGVQTRHPGRRSESLARRAGPGIADWAVWYPIVCLCRKLGVWPNS